MYCKNWGTKFDQREALLKQKPPRRRWPILIQQRGELVSVFRSLYKRTAACIYSSHLGLPRSPTLCVYILSASHGANRAMLLVFLKITVSMALLQHTPEWHSLNKDTSC